MKTYVAPCQFLSIRAGIHFAYIYYWTGLGQKASLEQASLGQTISSPLWGSRQRGICVLPKCRTTLGGRFKQMSSYRRIHGCCYPPSYDSSNNNSNTYCIYNALFPLEQMLLHCKFQEVKKKIDDGKNWQYPKRLTLNKNNIFFKISSWISNPLCFCFKYCCVILQPTCKDIQILSTGEGRLKVGSRRPTIFWFWCVDQAHNTFIPYLFLFFFISHSFIEGKK